MEEVVVEKIGRVGRKRWRRGVTKVKRRFDEEEIDPSSQELLGSSSGAGSSR